MQTNTEQTTADPSSNRKAIFSIVCGGHFINHFQSAMLGVISISRLLAMSLLVLLRAPANGPGLDRVGSPHMRQLTP